MNHDSNVTNADIQSLLDRLASGSAAQSVRAEVLKQMRLRALEQPVDE